jgi:transcriptional regulator with XRE-family HTH domain
MAKKLTNQVMVSRMRSEGMSQKGIARALNLSPSSVRRIEQGKQSGASTSAAIRELYGSGKRAREEFASGRIPLPSAPATKTRIVSPLERAAGQASQYSNDTKIVVHVTPKDGKSFTLYANGGIDAGDIKGSGFGSAVTSQAGAQGYEDDEIDWTDVWVEEY